MEKLIIIGFNSEVVEDRKFNVVLDSWVFEAIRHQKACLRGRE